MKCVGQNLIVTSSCTAKSYSDMRVYNYYLDAIASVGKCFFNKFSKLVNAPYSSLCLLWLAWLLWAIVNIIFDMGNREGAV